MSSILGTALSGLNRATLGVQAVASNVANLNTPGYRSVRVGGGSGQVEFRDASRSAAIDASTLATSDVDLASELIELKKHEHAYRATATLIDFEDRRLGELLDLVG